MGCGPSKDGAGPPKIIEEEVAHQNPTDLRVNFYATIANPIIHNPPSRVDGTRRCKLVVNQRMKLLTRVIGHDVVTINLGVVGGLTRHLDDPNSITVVTGGAGETWSLRFNDDALAQNFYQCVLLTQPFNVPKCQTIPLHFFQGHFRGAADIDENSLLDCVPQNPDGYIFSIAGGTVDQRAEWTATLRKISAVQDSEEEWLCEEADDLTAGGMSFLLWLNPKHKAYTGSVASQIVSAYPGQEDLNSPKSPSGQGQQNEAEIVALISQGEGTEGGASAVEGAEADEADKPASEASSSEDIAAIYAARLTNAPIGSIGAASFMLGETTFGFIASYKGHPDLMDQIGLGNPSLGAMQFDHVALAGDLDQLYIGNEDTPQAANFSATVKGAFGWRSTAPLGKVAGEQMAKGTLETGKYSIFKFPFVLPAVVPPVAGTLEARTFIVFFRNMVATDLPFTRLGGTGKPTPIINFSGLCCRDTQTEPVYGCTPGPVNFFKQQVATTAKGEVVDEVDQGVSVHTYVSDISYLQAQVLHITVRDLSLGHFVYGSAPFSLAQFEGKSGETHSFSCALNSNGRFGGRLTGLVTLLRTGDPTPRAAPTDGGVKRAPGELSAAAKLKARMGA